uniref:Uncharacterized protein n=1 Tax=Hyaloperonospora arabidopsidis (strain Emoy2) TaxID=559515 RepID=M4BSQ2_HYAAE
MPLNWQNKLACCGISYETVNELAMYFECLKRRERQTGQERLNGQAIHGKKGQGRRDQQRPFADWRRDQRNRREHCGTREDYQTDRVYKSARRNTSATKNTASGVRFTS